MCTRDTKDPLLRLFFDKYHVHLLATPREQVDVGQVYVHERGVTMAPGSLTGLLSSFRLPRAHRSEAMAEVNGQFTNQVKLGAALKLLEAVAGSMGLPGYLGGLQAEGGWDSSTSIRFGFSHVSRDWLDVVELGTALMTSTLKEHHPLIAAGRQYFVVTAVLRTDEITIESVRTRAGKTQLELEPAVGAGGSASYSGEGMLKVESRAPLAFAVEVHELELAEPQNRLLLKAVRRPVSVRNDRGARRRETFVPAEIGGRRGDPMLDVRYTV